MTMINWNEYELVLKETSDKECEVTGRSMGGTETFICQLSDLINPGGSPEWKPQGNYSSYGGYQAYGFTFMKADDEGVHLVVDKKDHGREIVLKPNETENQWSSGWYCFGEWSYIVTLTLRKKQ